MRQGTKSLLFGVHQFALHPVFVALGWRKVYGSLPRDPRVWASFAIHDLGYWGSPEMDGEIGVNHPEGGARLMARLFGAAWGNFSAGHSRYFAAKHGTGISSLMRADKMATVLMPLWLYVGLAWLSGEWREYLQLHIDKGGYTGPRTLLGWARHLREGWRQNYGA